MSDVDRIEDDEAALDASSVSADENTGRAVRIIWIDSGLAHHYGWLSFDNSVSGSGSRVLDCETVGIWMGENDSVVALAHSRDGDNGNWNACMTIYKPCIKKQEWLS